MAGRRKRSQEKPSPDNIFKCLDPAIPEGNAKHFGHWNGVNAIQIVAVISRLVWHILGV